ncbi:N-acyl-D-amino-acid deacylase family protein [Ruania zhangjianzhongii]|uniref:N-acyl-D-amino-acid deacylase family protein n=1 Tax=Ruania zhangjianzhongii TaxID=2603206 RepID=UPI0011CA32CB|nr:D-aminoacylase [Ruania zhangjianzhongii]
MGESHFAQRNSQADLRDPASPGTSAEPDLVIRGAQVLDGTGAPAVAADVAVSGGQIVAVGAVPRAGRTEIDARGLTLSPGFIDLHAHADLALLTAPERRSAITQGVTTEVIGQDGLSYAPTGAATRALVHERIHGWNGPPPPEGVHGDQVADFLAQISGAATNAAYLAPHGTIRAEVMGLSPRAASTAEIEAMCTLLEVALADGAVGLSAGLTYVPGVYATADELRALCAVVAAHGGYYAPHHRSYGRGALEAYAQCLDLARQTGVALHLTHAHLSFAVNRGRAAELLEMVDGAAREGLDVTMDTYPYAAGSSYLHSLLASAHQNGSSSELLALLGNETFRSQIAHELEVTGTDGSHGVPVDWSRIVISSSGHTDAIGRSIADLADAAGSRPVEVFAELVVDDELGTMCVVHEGDEANVRAIMAHPAQMAGSDGLLTGERPHPRAFGTFARYLGRYSRELGIVPLPQMVHKMTGAPAQRLGLPDRGRIAVGAQADLVCFDAETIIDHASYTDPRLPASGVEHVLVNGTAVLTGGTPTGARPGTALRRTDPSEVRTRYGPPSAAR